VLREALADAPSRRFFAAHAQSCLGSGLAHVVLPLLAYEHTGSAWAITAVLVPDLLPAILFGPLFGALVDRVGWRTCAIASDMLRFLACVLVVCSQSLPVLVLAAALAGTGTALFSPAALVGVTRLAPDKRRPAALGLFGALDDIGLTLGPALAIGLLAVVPPAALFGVNGASFVVSAVLLAGLGRRSPRGDRPTCACCSRARPRRCCSPVSRTSARSSSRATCWPPAAPASPRWSPPTAPGPCSGR
jgi:MFS family permease